MLSVEEVSDRIRQHELGDHADRIIEAIQPGWRLEPSVTGGAVRIGGDPRLAPEETWPVNKRGLPLAYLAEVDCGLLPPIPSPWEARLQWPHLGRVLRVFANVLDMPHEPTLAAVFPASREGTLSVTPHPELPDPFPAGGPHDDEDLESRYWRLDEHQMTAAPFLTVPECLPGIREHIYESSPLAERYATLSDRLRTAAVEPAKEAWGMHHLLGAPVSVQDDTRHSATLIYGEPTFAESEGVTVDPALGLPDAWRVLLALYTDDRLGLMIEDGGAWHILILDTALSDGSYDRAVCDVAGC